jgi:hypothetical protein
LSSPQPESRLLRLPAELRNEIYHYVLGGLSIRAKRSASPREFRIDIRDVDSRSSAAWKTPGHLLALTETCRQVYDETSLFPYSLNVFEYEHYYDLCRWTAALAPRQLGAISQLRVERFHLETLGWMRYQAKIDPDTWNEIMRRNALAVSLQRLTGLKCVIVVESKYTQEMLDIGMVPSKPEISQAVLDWLKTGYMVRADVDITTEKYAEV